MSAKTLSPGAHLLRHSRLFSLPPPLPKPEPLQTASGTFWSDTATLPYPTLAAITTPASSLARGDWGLKRSLPLRSTAETSTPVIRVGAVDNIAHITDFASAADHAITLKKWQELGVPMSGPQSRTHRAAESIVKPHQEAFNWDHDRTSVTGGGAASSWVNRRWRFGGPWLVGQTEVEFRRYLRKAIPGRVQEFREYLRRHYQQRNATQARREALERGSMDAGTRNDPAGPTEPTEPTEPVELSDEELDRAIRALRRQWPFDELQKHLHTFLDLPVLESRQPGQLVQSDLGPPKTHPSAGLSYLRTSSTLCNHPRYGPQATAPPVEARVLTPQRNALNLMQRPMLGVGGIVTGHAMNIKRVVQEGMLQRTAGPLLPVIAMDASTPGGGKCPVTPTRASVDSEGRISLHVEIVDQPPPSATLASSSAHSASVAGVYSARQPSPAATSAAAATTTSRVNFGYGTAGFPRVPASTTESAPTPRPFDTRFTSPAGGMADVLEGA